MKFSRVLPGLLALLMGALAAPANAQESKWFAGSSEHFILHTDTTEVKAQRLLVDLESRVAAFAAAFGTLRPRQFPIEVFLFKTREDFVAVMPRAPAGSEAQEKNAYLLTGKDHLFIIAKDKSPDDIANDVGHALGHALLDHEMMWRPFWLSEAVGEYIRKLNRDPDTKPVAQKDGYSVGDLLTIVPSDDYQDSDPGGAFRIQSYRLLRVVLQEKPQALRQWVAALDGDEGDLARLDVNVEAIGAKFADYVETPLRLPPLGSALKTAPEDPAKLSIHRADLWLAADRTMDASRLYAGDSTEARAGRAIVTRYSRTAGEALQQLERAAQDLPESGLVQYHFGVLDAKNKKDIDAQAVALEKAVKLMPLFGRAYAELARVYTLTGRAQQALPLVVRALELEPEFADHFCEIRAEALLNLGRSDEARRAMKLASDLPHADRRTTESYILKVASLSKRIDDVRRENENKKLEQIRSGVEATVNEREPRLPVKPEVMAPPGKINYEITAASALDVVNTVFPEYPDDLRTAGKVGRLSLRVDIGSDGKVKNAVVTKSAIPEMNAATTEAVKQWTFKLPVRARGAQPVSITLTFIYALQ